MSNLRYERVDAITKTELIRQIESGDPKMVAKALYVAARYDADWSWVQNQCLNGLNSPDVSVRWAAATCLGDLAFMRRPLNTDIVIPALERAAQDLAIADPASLSLSMVKQFLAGGSAPHPVE